MTDNSNTPVTERDRARRALELRNEGRQWAEIADELGYVDESGPRKAVQRLVDKIEVADIAEHRAIEGARLDALQVAHWDAAIGGDVKSAELILKILDRRAKLFGLFMPERLVVQSNSVGSDEEFAETIAGLLRDLASPEPSKDGDTEPWASDPWVPSGK